MMMSSGSELIVMAIIDCFNQHKSMHPQGYNAFLFCFVFLQRYMEAYTYMLGMISKRVGRDL